MHHARVIARARLVCLALGLAAGGVAVGDTLHVAGSPRTGAMIKSYRNGMFDYALDGQAVDPIAGDRVSYITLDDDPSLTAAEQAFVEGRWAQAADGYQASLKGTYRPWLKDWALPRMLVSADRAGKFDLAVSAFVQILSRDAGQAMKLRPRPGEETPAGALTAAAGELAKVSAGAAWTNTQKLALQSLLMDTQRVQGDLAGAAKLSEQLLRSAVLDKADPASARVVADVYIGSARLALAQKDYVRVISLIEQQKAMFTEASQQVEALYCLAAARDGQLGASPSADALKDLAIAYMRVVAVGRGISDRRYLPEALLRVGELQEQLGDNAAAATLYAEVAGEYKDSPAAARANARAASRQQRLKEKSGT